MIRSLILLLLLAVSAEAITTTDRGFGGNNTSATSITIQPSGNMAAGSAGILCIAADNSNGGTPNLPTSITDSAGNVWRLRITNNPTTANSSVEPGIYTAFLDNALSTSGSIVLNFAVSTPAKAWTLTEAIPSTAGNLVLYKNIAGKSTTTTTAAPTVTPTNVFTGNGDLWVAMGGAQSEDTWVGDADTSNGSWSTQQHAGFGTGAAGMSITSQGKVVTATANQTYNPTLTSALCILCFAILSEVPPKGRVLGVNVASEATTTIPFTRGLTAGSLGVLCMSMDNAGTGGASSNVPTSTTDTKGNTWTLRENGIYDPGLAGAGVELATYTAPITTSLGETDTVPITFTTANVQSKNYAIFEFSDATGYNTGGVSVAGAGNTTATPSITTSSITTPHYVVGVCGQEWDDIWTADTDTTNGSWSPALHIGNSPGSVAGMSLIVQYKKVTATGAQTYNVGVSAGTIDTMIQWTDLTVPGVATNPGAFLQLFP